ncbi:MAG: glycosyltransferase [Cyanobacteria bacterium J06607_13]
MRVAIVSSGFLPVIDGVTVSLYERLKVLSGLGHEVLVLCPEYGSLEAVYPNWRAFVGEVLPGVRVVGLPSEPFMGVGFERNLSGRAREVVNRELAAFGPVLVHVDEPDRIFLGMLRAVGVDYAKGQGIPCVGFYHTNFIDYIEDFLPLPKSPVWKPFSRRVVAGVQWFSMLFIRPVFHAYDAVLVSSGAAQARLQALGVRNVVCDRYLGVDVDRFLAQQRSPDFFQKTYGIEGVGNKVTLTFLGRLTPDKGWQFTLRALRAWVKDPANAELKDQVAFIVAGEGPLRDEIAATLQKIGLAVHFLGRIAPGAVPALLKNSDVHVTTSEKETLGLTVLEAFAAGIPVVAPAAGGVATLVRDGKNGLLFAPQDVAGFGRVLSRLVRDGALREVMGQRGQQTVMAYRWEKVVGNLVKTWERQIALSKGDLPLSAKR